MIFLVLNVMLLSITFISFNNFGNFIQNILNFDFGRNFNIILGFLAFLGILNFMIYFFVHLRINSLYFYSTASLLFVFMLILPFKFKPPRLNIWLIVSGVIVSLRIYLIYSQALAEVSFDTVHYLSYIIEAAKGTHLTEFSVAGLPRSRLSSLDDFSTYFYLLSGVYNIFQNSKLSLNFDILTLTMPDLIWFSTVIYVSLEILFTVFLIKFFKVKSLLTIFMILVLTQFFFGSMYFNSVFAIYGHTYRTLIAGFVVFLSYKTINQKQLNFSYAILISLGLSALLGVSSSGMFIGLFIALSLIFVLLFKYHFTNQQLSFIYLIFLPLVMFALNHFYLRSILSAQNSFVVFVIFLLMGIVTYFFKPPLYGIYRMSFIYLIPLGIIIFSFMVNLDLNNWMDFFIQRSYTDMVYNYLSFDNLRNILFNFMLWSSVIVYLINSKHEFKLYIVFIFIVMISPLSYSFVTKYLNYDLVYQRSYDAIFNPFTIVLFISFLMDSIKRLYILRLGLCTISIYLALHMSTNFYHPFFKPGDDFNGYKRLPNEQVEVFEVLNTKVVLENYDRAVVVSQIPSVKGFVSNIHNVLDFNTYRFTDRYSGNLRQSYSPIWNIFFPREYFGQPIFLDPPDYVNTCKYLIDGRIDFVLIGINQFYLDESGDFVPLFIRVRDCATEVFRNETYILYQFFWN
jgi:hypothetical protein